MPFRTSDHEPVAGGERIPAYEADMASSAFLHMSISDNDTPDKTCSSPQSGDTNQKKATQVERLKQIVDRADAKFFISEGQSEPVVQVRFNGKRRILDLSDEIDDWLILAYDKRFGSPPSDKALKRVKKLYGARARFDGSEVATPTRTGWHEGDIYVNLADDAGRVVKVTPDGWTVVTESPVAFKEPPSIQPLPIPKQGSFEALRDFVNLSQDNMVLLQALLVQALYPSGEHPLLVIEGEQGSGKTTLMRIFQALVDPSEGDEFAIPRTVRTLMIHAKNRWLLTYGNERSVSDSISDALSRLVTGGANIERKLYTDAGEHIFTAQQPVVINGIGGLVQQPDLIDRSVMIELDPIPPSEREELSSLWERFESKRPELLGAILSALSTALARREDVELNELPRMADFTKLAVAAEPAFSVPEDTFLSAYSRNRGDAFSAVLHTHPVASLIVDFLEDQPKGHWRGSASELQTLLQSRYEVSADFPSTPSGFGKRVREAKSVLRRAGITLKEGRTASSRYLDLTIDTGPGAF
jgi:energy-coupling factor transporter ATP-binding protein EcfA2